MRPALPYAYMFILLSALLHTADAASTPTHSALVPGPATLDGVELIERNDLFGQPVRAGIQISPDGQYLSWLAPSEGVLNIWVAPANDLSAARVVTSTSGRGINGYNWTYRPGTLLYTGDVGGDERAHVIAVDVIAGEERDLTPYPNASSGILTISARHPNTVLLGMNDRDPSQHDIFRVDLASGERVLHYRNDSGAHDFFADSDLKVRYTIRTRQDGGYEILQPDSNARWVKTGDIPFEDIEKTGPANLSNDGKTLYFTDSRERERSALFAIDTATGRRSVVMEDAHADVGDLLVDPATGHVQAVLIDHLRQQWRAVDPDIVADLEALQKIGPGNIEVTSRTLDGRTWIVGYSAPEQPAKYYRYDRVPHRKLTPLYSARPALEDKPLVPSWPVSIKARDGLTLVSYLTLPKHADPDADGKPDRPVPMVLLVHGGPWARDSYGYDAEAQWLANRGYAVLKVNFRGSTGFGKSFTNAGNGEWGGKMHTDLLDGVAWAVKHGVTTRDRVAIMGSSYGGYAVLAGLTFTPEVFSCGIDVVGPSDLMTLLGSMSNRWPAYVEQLYRRVGDPRTDSGEQRLAARSPLHHAQHIARPLLVAQGVNDSRVLKSESDRLVKAMLANSIPVTYALFPDEGHGFNRPENTKAFKAIAEGFLAQCLGGRAQPIGDDLDGSSLVVPTGADRVRGLREALESHVPDFRY